MPQDSRLASDAVFASRVNAVAANFNSTMDLFMAWFPALQASKTAADAADAKAAQQGAADAALAAELQRAAQIVAAAQAAHDQFVADLARLRGAQAEAYSVWDVLNVALQVVSARPVQATERLA